MCVWGGGGGGGSKASGKEAISVQALSPSKLSREAYGSSNTPILFSVLTGGHEEANENQRKRERETESGRERETETESG